MIKLCRRCRRDDTWGIKLPLQKWSGLNLEFARMRPLLFECRCCRLARRHRLWNGGLCRLWGNLAGSLLRCRWLDRRFGNNCLLLLCLTDFLRGRSGSFLSLCGNHCFIYVLNLPNLFDRGGDLGLRRLRLNWLRFLGKTWWSLYWLLDFTLLASFRERGTGWKQTRWNRRRRTTRYIKCLT